MKEIKRTEIESGKNIPLPRNRGVMVFKSEERELFYLRTNDLDKLFTSLMEDDHTEHYQKKMLEPLMQEYDRILAIPAEDDLEALVIEKQLLLQQLPEYHGIIRLYDHYAYLAINLHEPPFLTSKDDTVEDLLFIGPFQDRFFLVEAINAFNDAIKSPACHGVDYPCSLFGELRCPGYCSKGELEHMHDLIRDNIYLINEELLFELRKRAKVKYDSLEFEKAVALERMIEIIGFYYQYLRFFHTIKDLTGNFRIDDKTYTLRNGLLESVSENSTTHTFAAINNYFEDYRKKERLALPKENFREMWTIYKKIHALYPEKIDEIYGKSLLSIGKKLTLGDQ